MPHCLHPDIISTQTNHYIRANIQIFPETKPVFLKNVCMRNICKYKIVVYIHPCHGQMQTTKKRDNRKQACILSLLLL